jgi:DNA-binding NtrC family response regulator
MCPAASDAIVTRHPAMLDLMQTIDQVAPSDAPVLILGETGTGKELVARAIHGRSRRVHHPLCVVHCAALPESLLDAELFGHADGAFTGAGKPRKGRIAAAEHGTLFLDEIAEIPLTVQSKLLRLIQFKEIQRLGTDTPIKVELRILAATHRDLRECVRVGSFRHDLYHRIKVLDVTVPPLRERRDDIPLLIEHFMRRYGHERPSVQSFTPETRDRMLAYDYPGNVRELENIVQRCCALAGGADISERMLPAELRMHDDLPRSRDVGELTRTGLLYARREAIERAEREFLVALLARWPANLSQAARASGLRRSYLQRLLSRHRLRVGQRSGWQDSPAGAA